MSFQTNIYNMSYKDQLILSGKINDVGEYARINIPKSYRRGIEIEYGINLGRKSIIAFNTTLSQNKIENFTEYVDQYDANFEYLGQKQNNLKNTDISFSPNLIGGISLSHKPLPKLGILINTKYVSKQYLDNTSSEARSLPRYMTTDFKIDYTINLPKVKHLRLNLLINNLLDALYVSNGYSFGYIQDKTRYDYNYVYPQAGVNGLLGLELKF
jgi:iron complex outermembrane receptor protein